jgi:septal ring factor EnvC (AmiA/AmiB activator)
MDEETREGFADMRRGFARIDRYFELNQSQVNELGTGMQAQLNDLHTGVQVLDGKVTSMDNRLRRVEATVADIQTDLRRLRGTLASLFRSMRSRTRRLTQRVQRLERPRDAPA